MKKRTKVAAITLATVMGCGIFAGCDLMTQDSQKDLNQEIATVDLTKSEDFSVGGKYADYKEAISGTSISKRDLVVSFMSNGQNYYNAYGSYALTFNALCNDLVNDQVHLQYAKVYFFEKGTHTPEGYAAATAGIDDEVKREIAGLAYFLDDDEIAKAEYDVKVSFNNQLDSYEHSYYIKDHDHDEESTTASRTTPTGVNTANDDYYDVNYNIYTGDASVALGSYEKVHGSTVFTRKKAYNRLLSDLRNNSLIQKGEDTSKIENLSYYLSQKKLSYQNALYNKMTKAFEDEALVSLTNDYLATEYDATLENQKRNFANASTLSTALDSVSESSFVLTAPEGYGFVINILLPFSQTQKDVLEGMPVDEKGNRFGAREELLASIKATDQRGVWITESEDYAYEPTSAYNGGNLNRTYAFFEDSLKGTAVDVEYEQLKNYVGKYTYNGKVTEKEDETFVVSPNRITVEDFLTEMKNYMEYLFAEAGERVTVTGAKNANYGGTYYKADGTTDYDSFVYYKGKIDLGGYDASDIFLQGSKENLAYSVINELSFAYNTDTAGLNGYLGYAITAGKTSYVSEFEYAAQELVKEGAGSYSVVATDYGWHVMYCTLSYHGIDNPVYSFDKTLVEEEGTFSNLWAEAYKAELASTYASNKKTRIITSYAEACSTVYSERFADLTGLDG